MTYGVSGCLTCWRKVAQRIMRHGANGCEFFWAYAQTNKSVFYLIGRNDNDETQ